MQAKIALVLGGGGSRGLAHLGVLDVLKRENIPIDLIVGTSMGAIVGALFAAGKEPADIAEGMVAFQGLNIFGASVFTARGRQRAVGEQLTTHLHNRTFESLHVPLKVTAVDMVDGEEVVLEHGSLIPALLASSAVPGLFPPVELNGMQLLDGGVIDSVSTNVAYDLGYGTPEKPIIAVDVYPPLNREDPWIDPFSAIFSANIPFIKKSPGMINSIWRGYRVMAWNLHELRLQQHPPNILIRPNLDGTGSMDFTDLQAPFYAGMQEAEAKLDEIKALVGMDAQDENESAQAS